MKKNFFLCGIVGWCLEIFWTGFHALLSGEPRMIGQTSLLMFPIYGCAALIEPISKKIHSLPIVLRGCLYSVFIMTGELISGAILKYFGICPWDYSQSPYHVFGLIRLDYFPAWFCAGLLYEKLLNRSFLHHTSTWIEK